MIMEISKRELKDFNLRKFPNEISFKPIGIIHSPFKTFKGIPIQSSMSNTNGEVEIFPEFEGGLKDLDGFSHMVCLYYFDMINQPVPVQSKPFLDDEIKGVFAMRTPFRPNPIGLSIFQIKEIKNRKIKVNNIDTLDKTPVIDIKPYIPYFDEVKNFKIGWLKDKIKKMVS